MFESIKKMMGIGPSTDYPSLLKQGAIILDVRTRSEFSSGHIKGSINIPVDELKANLSRLPQKNKPVITCCASGMRSSTAKSLLQSSGYTQVYNGGGWQNLKSKL